MFKIPPEMKKLKPYPNITYDEMVCHEGGDMIELNPGTNRYAGCVQKFRTYLNEPFTFTSWLRTPAVNAKYKGSPNSWHLPGRASDIQTPRHNSAKDKTYTKAQWQNIVGKWHDICFEEYGPGVGSIEIRDNYFHIDDRPWPSGKFTVEFFGAVPADAQDYIPPRLRGKVAIIKV
jgi:hypothetical protein